MKKSKKGFTSEFLDDVRQSLGSNHLPRIVRCIEMLTDQQIWWRPNEASNSIGNIVLHLCGNVRQWIIAGLGGEPDRRERDKEFAERGPIPRAELVDRLQTTVRKASRIISGLTAAELAKPRVIQGFPVTGFIAVNHVSSHFAFHSGQIQYVTKLLKGEDLGFTKLPGDKRRRSSGKKLRQL